MSILAVEPVHRASSSSQIVAFKPHGVDSDAANRCASRSLHWAYSHGLCDRSDRDTRVAVLHAARLITTLDPQISAEIRQSVLDLVAWLAVASRTGRERLALDLLEGSGSGPRRFTQAADELRKRLRAFGFDVSRLRQALAHDGASSNDSSPLNDRVFQWVSRTLTTLGLCRVPTVHRVGFSFPSSWAADVNPLALEVEAEVAFWLRERGIIKKHFNEKNFEKFAVAEYAGWPCPSLERDQLRVMAALLSLWLLHDDVLEGSGLPSVELLGLAASGQVELDDPRLDNDYIRGWAELGLEIAEKMDPQWQQRQNGHFLDWARMVRAEAELVQRLRRTGERPTAESYLPMRNITIGMGPTIDLVEYCLGVKLPRRVLELPQVSAITNLAGALVAFPNELLGFSKDTSNRMLNLLDCLIASGRSQVEAFQSIAALHDETVAAYIGHEEALLESAAKEDVSLVEQWLHSIRHLIYGFGRWHFIAPRYSDVHRLSDGSIVRVVINT